MSTFFRGITKTVPSLFRGIFSEQNFDGNPRREELKWGEIDSKQCRKDETKMP
jgi:hypothetical protein